MFFKANLFRICMASDILEMAKLVSTKTEPNYRDQASLPVALLRVRTENRPDPLLEVRWLYR